MKYYVTADVHGFYTLMVAALEKAGYFADTTPHKLVILGDLFDRGHEAKELQSFVLDLMDRNEIILIRGNHEDLFVEMATTDHGLAYSHHISNGTFDTALQLTGYDPVLAVLRNYDFADAAKDTPLYQKIIPSMLDYYESSKYIFVHGWIPCSRERNGNYSFIADWRTSDEQEWMKARWYNGMAAAAQGVTEKGKTILCGHWHTSFGHSRLEGKGSEFDADADFSPYYGSGIIALDACTGHSGVVNCIVLEEEGA